MDRRGQEVAKDGVRGEVQIYCNTMMSGYLGNEEATRQTFTSDGWVRSGDVGYFSNGSWYVVDRTKDLIKVRGWQVSPAEVEAALLEHADIVDASIPLSLLSCL